MAKWIAAEKASRTGPRHAVVCPHGTGRTKRRIAQSKRCSCWFACHSRFASSNCANLSPPEVFCFVFLPMPYCLSLASCFSSLSFFFLSHRIRGPSFNRLSILITVLCYYDCPPTATRRSHEVVCRYRQKCPCPLLISMFLWRCLFFRAYYVLCPIHCRFLFVWRVCMYVFMYIYYIAHNRAIRPCHPSHSMHSH